MDLTIDISNNYELIKRASYWVRKKYNIPTSQLVDEEFKKEFNCELIMGQFHPKSILFNSEKDLTWFLLKWS